MKQALYIALLSLILGCSRGQNTPDAKVKPRPLRGVTAVPSPTPQAYPVSWVRALGGDRLVYLEWTDAGPEQTRYLVQSAHSASGPWEVLTHSEPGQRSLELRGLANGGETWMRVLPLGPVGPDEIYASPPTALRPLALPSLQASILAKTKAAAEQGDVDLALALLAPLQRDLPQSGDAWLLEQRLLKLKKLIKENP